MLWFVPNSCEVPCEIYTAAPGVLTAAHTVLASHALDQARLDKQHTGCAKLGGHLMGRAPPARMAGWCVGLLIVVHLLAAPLLSECRALDDCVLPADRGHGHWQGERRTAPLITTGCGQSRALRP